MHVCQARRAFVWAVLVAGVIALAASSARAQTGAESSVGYIDNAIPMNQFRFRFGAAFDDNVPDRAEFFYAKCGCFRTLALQGKPGGDLRAAGPPLPETRVDYQDFTSYLEVAASQRLSGFIEVPVRLLNPEQNADATGLADINAGFKYALLAEPDQYLTFQLRTFIPTGDADRGLGTDHVSLEPALLLDRRLCDQLVLEAEFRDWIPIGGSDFAGNVIRYGLGLGYDIYRTSACRVTPVAEVVGWTVLGGKEFSPILNDGVVRDAAGDTIVNAKLGMRVCGERNDVYVGYGRALTGDVWYKDVVRAEYRLRF